MVPAPALGPNKKPKIQVVSRFDMIIEKHLGDKIPPSVKAKMNKIMTEFSNNVHKKNKARKRKIQM